MSAPAISAREVRLSDPDAEVLFAFTGESPEVSRRNAELLEIHSARGLWERLQKPSGRRMYDDGVVFARFDSSLAKQAPRARDALRVLARWGLSSPEGAVLALLDAFGLGGDTLRDWLHQGWLRRQGRWLALESPLWRARLLDEIPDAGGDMSALVCWGEEYVEQVDGRLRQATREEMDWLAGRLEGFVEPAMRDPAPVRLLYVLGGWGVRVAFERVVCGVTFERDEVALWACAAQMLWHQKSKDYEASLRCLERGEVLRDACAPEGASLFVYTRAYRLWRGGDGETALERCLMAATTCEDASQRMEFEAAALLMRAYTDAPPTQAEILAIVGRLEGLRASSELRILDRLNGVLRARAHLQLRLQLSRRALDLAMSCGLPWFQRQSAYALAMAYREEDQFERALEVLDAQDWSQAVTWGVFDHAGLVHGERGLVLMHLGRWAEALAHLEDAASRVGAFYMDMALNYRSLRAVIWQGQGEHALAAQTLGEILAQYEEMSANREGIVLTNVLYGLALWNLGCWEEAREHTAPFLSQLRERADPARRVSGYAIGALMVARQDPDLARVWVEQARRCVMREREAHVAFVEACAWLSGVRETPPGLERDSSGANVLYGSIVGVALSAAVDASLLATKLEEIEPHRYRVDGQEVDLRRRSALQKVAAYMRARPGVSFDAYALFEVGWPGQRVQPEAMVQRVYFCMYELRRLGFGPWLETTGDGYVWREG